MAGARSGDDGRGDADRTQAIDPVTGEPTRAIDPVTGEPTRAIDPVTGEPTRAIDPVTGEPTRVMEASVPLGASAAGGGRRDDTAADGYPAGDGEDEPELRDKRREWLMGAGGVAIGLLLAVLVAFGLSDSPEDADLAAQEREAMMGAELEERDATIADLEARAEAAEAEAGEVDDEATTQREALDQRSAALDDREAALGDRDAALSEREGALDQREANLQQAEQDGGGGGGGGGGVDLPDSEEVESFLQNLSDRIAGLFD